MAPLSPETFRALVGRLGEDAFAEFVAALWRARGRAVERDGRLLVATGTPERRLYPDAAGRWPLGRGIDPPPEAEVVVTARRGRPPGTGDRRVVDADDLYEMALYGIDRDTCNDVFQRFFDRPPAESGGTGRPRVAAIAAVAVVLAALAATLVAASGLPLEDTREQGATEYPGRAGGLVTNVSGVFEVPAPNGRIDGEPTLADGAATNEYEGSALPPGVGPGGIVDAEALAAAHADRTEERRYRIELVHREIVGGNRSGVAREVAHVDPDGSASRVVETEGDLQRDPLVVATLAREGYPGDWQRSQEPYADRVERYLGWFLSVEESTVERTFIRDGRRFYAVEFAGEPWSGATNVTGEALVDERGVVHELRRSARVPGTYVWTVVTIRYEFADRAATNATVPAAGPPRWAGE